MKLAFSLNRFNEFFIKRGLYFWFVGLLVPFLYFSFLINIRRALKFSVKNNVFTFFFYILLLVQFISVLLSMFNGYFSFGRFGAILHNTFAFTFLFFGYYFAIFYSDLIDKEKVFRKLFYLTAIFSICVALHSFITKSNISYPGFLYFITGMKNDNTFVNFTHSGYILNFTIPRARVFGTFPNTTAFILVTLFSLFTITSKKPSLTAGIILIIACITTGARFTSLVSVLLVVLQFVNSRVKLIVLSMTVTILLFFSIGIINMISESRIDSNDTRSDLYYESIKLTNRTNPVFGLGLKPIVNSIADGELPVGSHSTFIGYYVKNGLVGFSIVVLFVLVVLILVVANIIFVYIDGINYLEGWKIFGIISMPILLSVLSFDDLDAYELLPFLLGMQIYFFEKSLLIRFKY